jgi:DNA polymerase-3 subunit gamma/tau
LALALALARKYRPSSFDSLVGQEAVARTLSLALDSTKLSHAYLFSGIRGSGKTSTARIFAKALLCENGPTSKPCQSCKQCTMANEGRHIDIIEMDAASNRGIDDIKELIEHTKYKPSIGRYKIFIIDEVHMLTTQAFNALLKTLEEPPEFVKFILATTDPLKLPATILSRTQHFRFKKIPQKIVKEHLEFILNKEGVEFSEGAVEIIARSGQGSIRDSLTLLDQAIVYANGKLDTTTVVNMLGVVDPATLDKLIESILQKDKDRVLEFIENFLDYEAEMIIDELTLHLKDMLLSNSPKLNLLTIDRFFRILSDAKNLLSIGSNGEFVLSLTLLKMVESLDILEIDDAIARLQDELAIPQASSNKNIKPQEQSSASTIEQKVQGIEVDKNQSQQQDASSSKSKPQEQASIPNSDNKEQTTSVVKDAKLMFESLQEKIYDRNYELGEVFKECVAFVSFEDNTLTWESSANEEQKKALRNGWSVIKLFVEEIFGIGVAIKATQKKNLAEPITAKKEPLNEQKIEEAEQKSSCIMPEGNSEASIDKDPKELLQEPMIKSFLELFEPKRVVVKQKT